MKNLFVLLMLLLTTNAWSMTSDEVWDLVFTREDAGTNSFGYSNFYESTSDEFGIYSLDIKAKLATTTIYYKATISEIDNVELAQLELSYLRFQLEDVEDGKSNTVEFKSSEQAVV
jgi:hypothetical protein